MLYNSGCCVELAMPCSCSCPCLNTSKSWSCPVSVKWSWLQHKLHLQTSRQVFRNIVKSKFSVTTFSTAVVAKKPSELMRKHGACSGMWEQTNRSRLAFEIEWIEELRWWTVLDTKKVFSFIPLTIFQILQRIINTNLLSYCLYEICICFYFTIV